MEQVIMINESRMREKRCLKIWRWMKKLLPLHT